MINTLIFDFGDVFIDLDKIGSYQKAMDAFGMSQLDDELIMINQQYEIGQITTAEFIQYYKTRFPSLSEEKLIELWNNIIKDFPVHRLEFLKKLKMDGTYNLVLLSNTNELHINFIKDQVRFYDSFRSQFDKFYLSHEIHLRKPNHDIYEFVLESNQLRPEECFFIDDTAENTLAAESLGINCWNIDPFSEDITQLFQKNSILNE